MGAKDPEARAKLKGMKSPVVGSAKKKASVKRDDGLTGKKRRVPDEDEVDYSAGDEGMGHHSDNDAGDSPPSVAARKDKRAKADKRAPKGEAMSFGEAMRTALGRHVPSTAPTPILAGVKKNKELEKERKESKQEKKEAKLVEAKKKWFAKERVVPDHADGNFEKTLMKIATKGTVQLFNAVQKQQKARNEEKGTAPAGKAPDAMSKGQFLDMLKGGKVAEMKTKRGSDEEDDDDEEGDEESEGAGDTKDFDGSDDDEDEDEDEDEVEFEGDWGDEGESEAEMEEDSEVEWD